MLNEKDKKNLNEFGKRRILWNGRIKWYSQLAETLDLESLDKEIKQYDDMRWFSKFFFKKIGLFLFGSISKKRKLLCYSALKKYIEAENNSDNFFKNEIRDLLKHHTSKLGLFSRFLKQLSNRFLTMKENNISSSEVKPPESNSENENKSEIDKTTEEITEDIDVREKLQEKNITIATPAFISSSGLLNAASMEVKVEIIRFGQFLVESEYRMQDIEENSEKVDKKIDESDKKIEELNKALKEEQDKRQKEKEEADKKLQEADKKVETLQNSVDNLTNLVKQLLSQSMSNNSNNVESTSKITANNGPGFFK